MSIVGRLVISVVGDVRQFNKDMTQVSRTLEAQTKGIKLIGDKMSIAGTQMTKAFTLPLVAAGAALLKFGTDFDNAYDRIRIGTGKTGKELEELQKDFKAVGKVAPSSFNDISIAVAGFNQKLGLTGKPLQTISTQILNLSRLTKTDLNTNVENAAKLFNNWNIAVKDQSKTLDLMFRASQQTGIGVDKLMDSVTQFGPILRGMGFDLETTTALVAQFDKEGIDMSAVTMGMKIALKNMAQEGFTDPQEVLGIYIERIKTAKTDIEAVGIAAELFGARGGPAMAMAIREGRLNLDDLIASLKTGKDTINDAANATDDWTEKLTLLKNNLGMALEPLATRLFEGLGKLVIKVTPQIEELIKKFGDLSPEMQNFLLQWGGIIAISGPALLFLGNAAKSIIALTNAVILLNAAVAGGLLGKLITFLPQVALALGLIKLQTDSSAEAFKGFEEVQTALKSPMYLFGTAAEDVRIQMQMLQDTMKVTSAEGAEYLRQKMIALSNDFLTGKITAEDLAYGLSLLNTSVIPTTKSVDNLAKSVEQLKSKTIYIDVITRTQQVMMGATPVRPPTALYKSSGGVIPSASAGMITPSFDNGGILAMLHKNEVVLNSGQTKNLAELIFGLANKKTDIAETPEYQSNQPIEIRNIIELDGSVLYDKVSEGLSDLTQIQSRGMGKK
jgi:phage-related minor tail protein